MPPVSIDSFAVRMLTRGEVRTTALENKDKKGLTWPEFGEAKFTQLGVPSHAPERPPPEEMAEGAGDTCPIEFRRPERDVRAEERDPPEDGAGS